MQLKVSLKYTLVFNHCADHDIQPLIVNRTLQSIVQHPHFYRVCGISTRTSAGRDACLKALHVLFNLHPANTCQITHVEPLVRLYGGTLSNSDRMLLSIFQLFEEQRKTSIASLFSRWSSSPDVTSKTVLEAVQSLDANLVLRTCLQFPKRRRLEGRVDDYTNLQQSQLYDPVFLILLLAQTLADDVPETAPAWVELFRTNIVGLLIRGLSSSDDLLREVSISQLATLWKLLEVSIVLQLLFALAKICFDRPLTCKRSLTSSIYLLSSKIRFRRPPVNRLYDFHPTPL